MHSSQNQRRPRVPAAPGLTTRGRATRVLFASLLLTSLWACGREAGEGPIVLGLAGPLERPNGLSMQRGAELAIEEINRNGGIEGRPLELRARDDGGDPERAVAVATELRSAAEVVAVVGHTTSGATLAAAPVYNSTEHEFGAVLQVSPSSSSPEVTRAGEWTFRMCPTDLVHGPALATWARRDLGLRRVAVLYANDPYGRDVTESFARAFEAAGGEVIARDPYLPTLFKGGNVDPYLLRAIRAGADGLLIAGQATDGGISILGAARTLGFRGAVMGPDGMTNVAQSGAVAQGSFVSSAWLPDRPGDRTQAFVREFGQRFGALPDHRAAFAYDAVHLLARTLRDTGPDREALRERFAEVGRGEDAFDGITGRTEFDEAGDVKGKNVTIGVVRGAQLVTASR